jgi:Xaa-Pro aminopeptidase
MYFAIETYSGRPGVQQAARLEQNLVVTKDGPQVFTLFPFEEEMLK